MPKATVDEDGHTHLPPENVGLAPEVRFGVAIHPIPDPPRVENPSDKELRLSVATALSTHT